MGYSLEQRFWCQRVSRLGFVFVFVFVCVCLVGPTMLWHLKDNSKAQISCPTCHCHCPSQTDFLLPPGPGLANTAYSGCGENDPDLKEELEKDTVALLSEEIALQKIVHKDTKERTSALILYAKRASSHFQKEAEKCIAGVETCEGARERAEAQLRDELKLTSLWEKRARQLGWKRRKRVYS